MASIILGKSPESIHRKLRSFADECHGSSKHVLDFGRLFSGIHSQQLRSNGTSAKDHVVEVERRVKSVLRDPKGLPAWAQEYAEALKHFNRAVRAASFLHDTDEDVLGVVALDEEFYNQLKLAGISTDPVYKLKLILNQELERYGPEGAQVSYMVYNVTKPENKQKFHYMQKLINKLDKYAGKEQGSPYPLPNLGEEGVDIRFFLLIYSLLLKTADRASNTKSAETYVYDGKSARILVGEAEGEKDKVGALVAALEKKHIKETFVKGGKFLLGERVFSDAAAFREFENIYQIAMGLEFENHKRANALDNFMHFLPEVERILLIGAGLGKDGTFSLARAEDFTLYDYAKMRNLVRNCYVESLKIWDSIMMSAPNGQPMIGLAMDIGAGKHAGESGEYKRLLKAIREEQGI